MESMSTFFYAFVILIRVAASNSPDQADGRLLSGTVARLQGHNLKCKAFCKGVMIKVLPDSY